MLFFFPELLRKKLLDQDLGRSGQVKMESPLKKKILDSKGKPILVFVKSLTKGLATTRHAALTTVCIATRGLFNKAL